MPVSRPDARCGTRGGRPGSHQDSHRIAADTRPRSPGALPCPPASRPGSRVDKLCPRTVQVRRTRGPRAASRWPEVVHRRAGPARWIPLSVNDPRSHRTRPRSDPVPHSARAARDDRGRSAARQRPVGGRVPAIRIRVGSGRPFGSAVDAPPDAITFPAMTTPRASNRPFARSPRCMPGRCVVPGVWCAPSKREGPCANATRSPKVT